MAHLDRVHEAGAFAIHYTTRGEHALASSADLDEDGIPDAIQDIATQLVAASAYYSDVLGLRFPLAQPRYAHAGRIRVFVVSLRQGRGVAYDEVVRETSSRTSVTLDCGLKMLIDRNVAADRNATPAHELFHLYQYGYAMFKRSGYLEGMARWLESAFLGDAASSRGDVAVDKESCVDVMSRSYAAAGFWRGRGSTQPGLASALPPSLRRARYVGGAPVFRVATFEGGYAVRPVLEALQSASAAASVDMGLAPHDWPEALQRSARFDSTICRAVEAAR
ncbi:MAG: hypothetical protein ACTIJY_06590 [Luteimonas sp.]